MSLFGDSESERRNKYANDITKRRVELKAALKDFHIAVTDSLKFILYPAARRYDEATAAANDWLEDLTKEADEAAASSDDPKAEARFEALQAIDEISSSVVQNLRDEYEPWKPEAISDLEDHAKIVRRIPVK